MASDQEVINARLQIADNEDLETQLTNLSNIVGGSGAIDILFKRDGVTFNFSRLKTVLESGNANEDTMIAAVEADILAVIGADEVTQGTVRKELRDLVDAHDADIAAT